MSGISKIVTIMKKIMKPFVLVAAAAMALASCQKNEIPAPEKQEVHFTINAGIETKTSIVESEDIDENGKPIYRAQWDGNEELGVLFAAPTAETTASNVVTLTNAESGSLASFQGTVTVDQPAGTFYAFYPAAAFNRGYGEGDARLDLKNVQKPTATSFDPSCDILVAKPYRYEVVDGKVVADGLEFARLMSVLRIDLKSEFPDIQNEFVESVSFTAGDVEITGYARVFLDNPKFDKWASNGAQWCTVTANYDSDLVSINGTSNSVYLVIAPVTIPANKDLTFEIKTKNYNISKTIKSPEMKFTAGKVSKINLTIAADNCDKIDTSIDYSGEWLITGVNASQTYAVSAYVDGNNLDILVPITVADEKITEVDGLANCKMTITKVPDGDYAGMYTIEDANSTEQKRSYLYAAGTGNNNYLKAGSTLSAGSYWDITKNDNGTYTIIASIHTSDRNTIWYNTTNNIFSCYQSNSASYKPITLYPYSMVVPDTTPKLELGEESIELTAAGGEGTIDVTARNLPADIQVRALTTEGAQEEVEWLTASYADGVITYTAEANESTEARTAYIEVYVSDDLKAGVSVTQEAAGVTKQYYVKVTTAPNDWSGTYLMVCDSKNMVLSGISTTSTKYGIGSAVEIADNKIEATETLASYQVVLSPGSTSGSYLMKFKDSYLYWSSGNSLATNANNNSNTNWLLSVSDGNVTIENCKDNTRVIRWNASSPRFACYTSGQTAIQLYKLEDGNAGGETPDPEPEEPAEPETPTYESLEDLVAAGAPSTTATKVNVTLENEEITEIYVTNQGYRNGVFLQAGDREIEIYCRNVPEEWVVGGTVSGKLTECDWKLYNDIWELCPEDWSELSYTAPVKTLTSIAVSGQKAEFTVGDTFEFGGIVTATYSDGSTADVTGAATFSGYNMNAEGSQTVTVTYEGKTTTYTISVTAAGGETPDPETPSQGELKTATILFGTPNVKINSASVTGTDSQQNTWTITTIGTSSWTQQPTYSQVGSSSKPATTITFTTKLPANASVSNISAKFGGFNGTAGTVTLKVGDTSIGTGKLNATNDVVVNSTSTASGNVVTVTVTGISKGVKCYYITVEYTN